MKNLYVTFLLFLVFSSVNGQNKDVKTVEIDSSTNKQYEYIDLFVFDGKKYLALGNKDRNVQICLQGFCTENIVYNHDDNSYVFKTNILSLINSTFNKSLNLDEIKKEQKQVLNKLIKSIRTHYEFNELDASLETKKDKPIEDVESDKPHVVSFDFEKRHKGFKIPKNIKKGDFYIVKIDNINPNIWSVNFETKDTTILKTLKTPTFNDISFDALSNLVASFKSTATSVESVKGFNVPFIHVLPISSGVDGKCDDFNDETLNLMRKLKDAIGKLEDEKKNFNKIIYDITAYELKLLEDEMINTDYDYMDVFSKISVIFQNLETIRNNLNDEKISYQSELNYNEFKGCFTKDKTMKTQFEKNLALLDAFSAKIIEFKELLSAHKVIELVKSVHFLNNENEYTSLPQQLNGDYTDIVLNLKPKQSEYNKQSYSTKFRISTNKSSSYWSLSTSFYVSNLYNERFSSIGEAVNDSTTVYRVIKERSDKAELGIGTLLRYGYKSKSVDKLGYHLSFGPGINIGNTIRPRLLFGGGINVGKKHGLSIDIGGVAGYVERKSNTFDLNTTYQIKPDITAVTQLKLGWFFSIGYMHRL